MSLVAWLMLSALAGMQEDPRTTKAKAMLDALNKGDYPTASQHFDATMKEKMPKDKTLEIWGGLDKQVGKFKKVTSVETRKVKDSNIVDLICEFDKMALRMRVSFDKDERIQGFFLLPAVLPKFEPPSYAKADTYREEKVTVGQGGDWPLPGTLTLPTAKDPVAAVVLVHGSGPHDRDETIGPNKPFRDIAWGLASQGIAVLRYERRTFTHGSKLVADKTLTLKEEVTDDALAAVKLVRERKEIDPKRVFVLGHSLGAMAAPQIGAKDERIAGLILLAGNSRPLEDLVLEQFTYIYSLDGPPGEEQKKELAKIKKQVDRVKAPKLAEAKADELPLEMPALYWKSIRDYDQKATAAKLTMPMLVLQGERDYQVTMEDFAGWKKALAERKDVRFKSYPKLNHLFHLGKGKAKPEEYGNADHVAREVIDDVAAWIKER